MYDPLAHYIKEGLVQIHSYPHPEIYGKLRGRFIKTGGIEMEVRKDSDFNWVMLKRGHVWFSYKVVNEFYEDYATSFNSREESIAAGDAWLKEVEAIRSSVNLKELA